MANSHEHVRRRKWDLFFLRLAREVSTASRDPSTKVGAVIVNHKQRIVSLGFNGFPRGVSDTPERYADRATKLELVVHAEVNAILFAHRDLDKCTLYTWPMSPCMRCCVQIIQADIARVVSPIMPEAQQPRWQIEMDRAVAIMHEAGIVVDLYPITSSTEGVT